MALSRRELLALAGGGTLALLGGCPALGRGAGGEVAMPEELQFSSVRSLASAIARGELSSVEVVRSHLARIDRVNAKLNAVVQLAADRALEEARAADAELTRGESRGPLHGVPMTIKDSFDTEGVISTGGTKGRAAFVPQRDATVVARLREAGAILLGKTNTPELTLSYETNNLIYGRTNNPYDPSRTPGGSSGGAAAILAAGGSPFDLGSDYGGSIRLPSHCCGTAGIKPTSGRVPRTGHIIPFGGRLDSFQQIGPMARFADDLILLLPLLAGPDGIDPFIVPTPLGDPEKVAIEELRVAFHTDNGILAPTTETADVIRAAARSLAQAGAHVEERRPTGIEESYEIVMGLWASDGSAGVRRLLQEAGTDETSLTLRDPETALSGQALDALHHRWDRFRSSMLSFLRDFDLILSPVNAAPALPHGEALGPEITRFSYTMTYNLTGWPGTVVRGGTSPEGLPIGVQVISRPWREDVSLAAARYLEGELGGFRPPPI